ncbi:ATP synthase subunit I [Maridesulfovibrio bastinii]|uniref:ATP synthase subunit I n=1 Tax=Maridesulfovibrio bastinii TaxID=47157 RepID=UPI0004852B6C|nr:ATP synthase subunit I [Maridesulfovibrio bastinii]
MKTNQKIESFLRRRGFTHPDIRCLVRNQLYLALGACVFAVMATGSAQWTNILTPWAMAFAAGTLLISINFWSLAKFGQHLVYMRKGAVTSLLIRFYLRLILTGVALYGLIAYCNLPIVAILAGLSTVVVNAIFWGVAGLRQKVKEA